MSAVSFYLAGTVPVRLRPFAIPSMALNVGYAPTAQGGVAPVPRTRGDIYEARGVAFGTRDEIATLVAYLDANRDAIPITGIATPFLVPLIAHESPITAYIRREVPEQKAYASQVDGFYEVALAIRAVSFSSVVVSGSLASLRQRGRFISGHQDVSAGRFSYEGVPSFADTLNGQGVFRETFYQSTTETAAILQFWREHRGRSFVFPSLAGVQYPFGPDRPSVGDARAVLEVDSVERANLHFYLLRLSFIEAFR